MDKRQIIILITLLCLIGAAMMIFFHPLAGVAQPVDGQLPPPPDTNKKNKWLMAIKYTWPWLLLALTLIGLYWLWTKL